MGHDDLLPQPGVHQHKLSKLDTCPDKIHYHSLKHALKFLYNSRNDGIYFWQTAPCIEFPEGPAPHINSNRQDILHYGRPQLNALIAHAYVDSD
jgi:hypothetical protein